MSGNFLGNQVIWLTNVSYFNNAYSGDLIVVNKTIYYFAHTNIDGERNETLEKIKVLTQLFGLLGLVADLCFAGLLKLTSNSKPSQLAEAGIIFEGDATAFQQRLEWWVEASRQQPADIDLHSLIKPLKFTTADVKNLKVGLKKLKFDSEFDDHSFEIGIFRKKHLEVVLSANGFLTL